MTAPPSPQPRPRMRPPPPRRCLASSSPLPARPRRLARPRRATRPTEPPVAGSSAADRVEAVPQRLALCAEAAALGSRRREAVGLMGWCPALEISGYSDRPVAVIAAIDGPPQRIPVAAPGGVGAELRACGRFARCLLGAG